MTVVPASTALKAAVTIERVSAEQLKISADPSPSLAPRLGAILSAQVLSGTSNNFLIPFTAPDATTVFAKNVSALEAAPGPGGVIMWVARLPDSETPLAALDVDGGETGHGDVVGSVQLAFHMAPNGQFRSEVRKLLVDERYQRRGIARRLMGVLEDAAREHGSTLCGGPGHKLYESMGWQTAGIVPNYALVPDGSRKNGAVFMYKEL